MLTAGSIDDGSRRGIAASSADRPGRAWHPPACPARRRAENEQRGGVRVRDCGPVPSVIPSTRANRYRGRRTDLDCGRRRGAGPRVQYAPSSTRPPSPRASYSCSGSPCRSVRPDRAFVPLGALRPAGWLSSGGCPLAALRRDHWPPLLDAVQSACDQNRAAGALRATLRVPIDVNSGERWSATLAIWRRDSRPAELGLAAVGVHRWVRDESVYSP